MEEIKNKNSSTSWTRCGPGVSPAVVNDGANATQPGGAIVIS